MQIIYCWTHLASSQYAMQLSSGEFGRGKSLRSERKGILTNPAGVTQKTVILSTNISGGGGRNTVDFAIHLL